MGHPPGSKNKPKPKVELLGTGLPAKSQCKRVLSAKAKALQAADMSTIKEADGDQASTPTTTKIHWDQHQDWTFLIIEYLKDNTSFCHKLFSDSSREAKKEGQKKVQGKDGKNQLYADLATHVFAKNSDAAIAAEFSLDHGLFAKSVGQHLARFVNVLD